MADASTEARDGQAQAEGAPRTQWKIPAGYEAVLRDFPLSEEQHTTIGTAMNRLLGQVHPGYPDLLKDTAHFLIGVVLAAFRRLQMMGSVPFEAKVKQLLAGELGKNALKWAAKAKRRFEDSCKPAAAAASNATTPSPLAAAAELELPPELFLGLTGPQCPPCVDEVTAVQTAAVLEYLSAELLELAGDAVRDLHDEGVWLIHLLWAIQFNEELNATFHQHFGSARAFIGARPDYRPAGFLSELYMRIATALLTIQLRERPEDEEAADAARAFLQQMREITSRGSLPIICEMPIPSAANEEDTPTALGRVVKPLHAIGLNVGDAWADYAPGHSRDAVVYLGLEDSVIGESRDESPHFAVLTRRHHGGVFCVHGFCDEMQAPSVTLLALSFPQFLDCIASALEDTSRRWLAMDQADLALGYEPWRALCRPIFPDFATDEAGLYDSDDEDWEEEDNVYVAMAMARCRLMTTAIRQMPITHWSAKSHARMPRQLRELVVTFFLCCLRHRTQGDMPALPLELQLQICEFLRTNDGGELALF